MRNEPEKQVRGNRKGINLKRVSADVRLQEFFRDNERFADVFNGCLFHGSRRVVSEELREMDTNVSASILSREIQAVLKRTRDVMKFTGEGTCFRILGIENQQHIHYAMPLRTMIYDSLSYLRRAEEMIRKNRRDKTFKIADEFLSGMKKETRLLCVNEMAEYPFENRDVFQLFQAVHELYQNAGSNMPETLQSVGVMTACTAAAITGTTKALEKELEKAIRKGKESINMCEAFQRALKKERKEGRTEGCVEMAVRMLREGAAPEMVQKCAQLSAAQWQTVMKQAKK